MSFQKKLASGEFVLFAEFHTPKGVDISELVTNAQKVKDRVDGVFIPDMDSGVMRMSALAGGALMRQQGIDPIIHIYGRDRNRMALQGDLLAAHVLGIRGVLTVKGVDIPYGDHVGARAVDDLDEIEILKTIQSLKKGTDMAGFQLSGAPQFTVGCMFGPNMEGKALDEELARTEAKIAAGAQFLITPPVFDLDRFKTFMDKAAGLGVPIIPTVFLLKTVGVARYMAAYEPGVFISEDLIKRIRKAPDRESECLLIAGETVKALKGLSQGVRLVTLGWENRIPAVLDNAGL